MPDTPRKPSRADVRRQEVSAQGTAADPLTSTGEAARPPQPRELSRPQPPAHSSEPGPVGELFAPIAGFGVTFTSMFRKVVTEQYPREKIPPKPRYHGRHQLNRHPDGLEKCIGCELCAWACPADAIYVEADMNTDDERHSPGERYGRVYQINYLRCIGCGLCIEACPTRALTMTNDYEIVGTSRTGMIFEKVDLLGPMAAGMLAAPHPMAPGTEAVNYYRGEVTGATPEQVAWVREQRPDEPTLSQFDANGAYVPGPPPEFTPTETASAAKGAAR